MDAEKELSYKTAGEKCKVMELVWNLVWRLLKKRKMELTHHLAKRHLYLYTTDSKSYQKDARTSMFIAILFAIDEKWK